MADWIDRDAALQRLLIDPPNRVGLDTEFMRTDTFLPKLALVQIALGSEIAVIDPVADIDLAPLGAHLAKPTTTSVMHSASEDLEALATVVPNSLGRLFDTQIAAAFAGLGAGLGYQKLVAEIAKVDLPKGETRSDWLARPLSPQQFEYAAQDVIHLDALHSDLSARLEQRGFSAWHAEDCERLVERARKREPDAEPQVAFRGAFGWPRERQALLRRLLLWREATARSVNRPRPWVLDDPRALDLAFRPPNDADALFERVKGLRALRGAQRAELLEVLQRPLDPSELDFAPIPAAPGPADKNAIAALKAVVTERATALDLPEGLLCARRHLESLLATREWPRALDGWRREVLFEPLMAALASL